MSSPKPLARGRLPERNPSASTLVSELKKRYGKCMENHPNIDSLLKLVEEIQDLQKAKDLLEEVWLADRLDGKLSFELYMKLNDYFEFDDSE